MGGGGSSTSRLSEKFREPHLSDSSRGFQSLPELSAIASQTTTRGVHWSKVQDSLERNNQTGRIVRNRLIPGDGKVEFSSTIQQILESFPLVKLG
jgi:hypothetical protein